MMQLDNFPQAEELRTVAECDNVAVTIVRSTMSCRPILDAMVAPNGDLLLIDEYGDMIGSVCPRLLEKFSEAA